MLKKSIVLGLFFCLLLTQAETAGAIRCLDAQCCNFQKVQRDEACDSAYSDRIELPCAAALAICGCLLLPSPASIACVLGCLGATAVCLSVARNAGEVRSTCLSASMVEKQACVDNIGNDCV